MMQKFKQIYLSIISNYHSEITMQSKSCQMNIYLSRQITLASHLGFRMKYRTVDKGMFHKILKQNVFYYFF